MKKLSFSINSSKPKTTSRPKAVSAVEPTTVSTSSGPQFVTEFDPTKPLSSEPDSLVIAPISNSDYIKRFKPNLPLPTAEDDPNQFSTETQFVLDTNNSADPSGLPYGLSVRSDKEKEENGKNEENGRGKKRVERGDELKRFKEEIQNLPEDRGQDEFLDVSVQGFGAAILRGYGWSEGTVIGRNKNKEDTKVVDYEKRAGTYGLGFNPSASDPKKKRGGDWTLPVNNGKKAKTDNKDLERERTSRSRREDDVERERDDSRRYGNNVEEERDGRRRNDKVVERERTSSRRKEDEREGERATNKRHMDEDSRNKERERVSSSSRSKRERHKEAKLVRWLTSHIKVRIISKDFKSGKYYLKKGEILDVVGPTTCDISIDGTRELVQGVEQEMLETALPKKGGAVLVLRGKNKGVFGNLMEKDLEEETGVVRDADSHELINVKLEQIAEYVGDPSYLDY